MRGEAAAKFAFGLLGGTLGRVWIWGHAL